MPARVARALRLVRLPERQLRAAGRRRRDPARPVGHHHARAHLRPPVGAGRRRGRRPGPSDRRRCLHSPPVPARARPAPARPGRRRGRLAGLGEPDAGADTGSRPLLPPHGRGARPRAIPRDSAITGVLVGAGGSALVVYVRPAGVDPGEHSDGSAGSTRIVAETSQANSASSILVTRPRYRAQLIKLSSVRPRGLGARWLISTPVWAGNMPALYTSDRPIAVSNPH